MNTSIFFTTLMLIFITALGWAAYRLACWQQRKKARANTRRISRIYRRFATKFPQAGRQELWEHTIDFIERNHYPETMLIEARGFKCAEQCSLEMPPQPQPAEAETESDLSFNTRWYRAKAKARTRKSNSIF